MTAITEATTVIETLIGRTLTGAELSRIGDAFFSEDAFFIVTNSGITNPSNEEKAQLFLDTILDYCRRTVRGGAETAEYSVVSTQISDAGDTAVDDLM